MLYDALFGRVLEAVDLFRLYFVLYFVNIVFLKMNYTLKMIKQMPGRRPHLASDIFKQPKFFCCCSRLEPSRRIITTVSLEMCVWGLDKEIHLVENNTE